MRTTLAPLLGLLLAACGSTGSGTDSHASDGAPTTTTTTTSGTSSTTTHDHVTTGHAHTGSSTGGESPIDAYCDCMLLYCHDQYHGTWGEEHPASEDNCRADAGMLPSADAPAMSGNSLECRLYHCEAAIDDPTLCDAAIGGAPCL